MTLREKAQKEAKKSGVKVSKEVLRGLKAVENMHTMCVDTGSAYRIFVAQKGR